MKDENELKLLKAFPKLYAFATEFTEPIIPMYFGFECGDGWFKLIWDLSKKLTALSEDIQALQVKEKFGSLRFYVTGGSNKAYEAIERAERKSWKICEVCGAPGKLIDDGWMKTRCKEHE